MQGDYQHVGEKMGLLGGQIVDAAAFVGGQPEAEAGQGNDLFPEGVEHVDRLPPAAPRARLDLTCSAHGQSIPTSASVDGGGDIGAAFFSPNRRRNAGPDVAKARGGQNERSTWRVSDRRKTP